MYRTRKSNSVLFDTTKRKYVLEIFYQCPRKQNLLTKLLCKTTITCWTKLTVSYCSHLTMPRNWKGVNLELGPHLKPYSQFQVNGMLYRLIEWARVWLDHNSVKSVAVCGVVNLWGAVLSVRKGSFILLLKWTEFWVAVEHLREAEYHSRYCD